MRVVTDRSLFDSSCDYLTNTINIVGAMGAGLALEFRLRVPEMYELYKDKCGRGEIQIGKYWIYDKPNRMGKKILNFPVKRGFNHPSTWDYVIRGMDYFLQNYERDGITSIAMPTLGARLGKLPNEDVLEMMRIDLENLPILVEVYQSYSQDRLTKWVKGEIASMSVEDISRQLGLSMRDSGKIKNRVSKAFLLSDLVAFNEMSVSLVQVLYDYAYRRMADLKLHQFTQFAK